MPRVIFQLTPDVWTDIGTGELIMTVHREGVGGQLLLNNEQVDATALIISRGRAGDQFANNVATDTVYVKATTPDWEVASDLS